MTILRRTAFVALMVMCSLAMPAGRSDAQIMRRPEAMRGDTAQLRRDLSAALGSDFDIVRHELSEGTPERSGTFWLVHVRPKRSGSFYLDYRYRYVDHHRPENPLYTHVRHATVIRVGGPRCRLEMGRKEGCAGDVVILPFVLNDYTGHTFTVTSRDGGQEPPDPPAPHDTPSPEARAVANPAGRLLEYLGTDFYESPHRNGGATYVFSARFRARAAGRLNLSLSAQLPGATPPSTALGARGDGVPILIVERGQPMTTLLGREDVTGTDSIHHFSSHSGNEYATTLHVLQPGDTLTLEYYSVSTRPPYMARQAPPSLEEMGKITPVITRHPFYLDPESRFNAWIIPWILGGSGSR